MSTCSSCGGTIIFRHDGFNVIPIHLSGGCSGGRSKYSGGWRWVIETRESSSGKKFKFKYPTYASYVNPNAHCPVCGCDVYFYQSPFGGRVFFDELGPDWPKHACTDSRLLEEKGLFWSLEDTRSQVASQVTSSASISKPKTKRRKANQWQKKKWLPLLCTKTSTTAAGLRIEGRILLKSGRKSQPIIFRQVSSTSVLTKSLQDDIKVTHALTTNSNQVSNTLYEDIVFVKQRKGDLYSVSTISVGKDDLLTVFEFEMIGTYLSRSKLKVD